MIKKLQDRRVIILFLLTMVFVVLIYKLADITITNGEYYYEQSINNRIRKVDTVAKRGDIYDSNGSLIATSDVGYVVKFYEDAASGEVFNDVAIQTIKIFEKYNEEFVEFPISIDQYGDFHYIYDDIIDEWKISNGYSLLDNAEKIFNDVRANNYVDEEMSNYEAYNILYNKGISLPLSSSELLFNQEIYKNQFLYTYRLEEDISAKDAFEAIKEYYDIDEKYTDKEAYSILVFEHLITEKGYYKYEPITVANDISKDATIAFRERSMDLPGIVVEGEPIRTYPFDSSAAHIFGYMGTIAMPSEIEKYINQNDYNPNVMIGKTGIEGTFELELSGKNGFEYVEVDAYGQKVGEVDEEAYGLEYQEAKAGDDIVLTIDMDLQKTLEDSLEKVVGQIQQGGTFESPWGNYTYDAFPNAKTGAGVVVDVNTGKVLAMASYPSYDLNLFSTGISQSDWNDLNPLNPNDPLAPRALYNLATMVAAPPGSVYKMITGYAAVESGLDPYERLYTDGYVELGNQTYACWYFNDYGGKHGYKNLIEALEVSCNFFMFDIATGYNYYRDKPLDYIMGPETLIEESKKFGLDDNTGIEIAEQVFGVPNPEKKRQTILYLMKIQLSEIIDQYFPLSLTEDEDDKSDLIDEIISWVDDDPSRGDIINALIDAGANNDYYVTEQLADIIKYDYFNLIEWYDGDTLNLSIGQGDHVYTPVQIARYIMAIANGGYLHELTLVESIGDEKIDKTVGVTNTLINSNDTLQYIQEGMYESANGTNGTSSFYFNELPLVTAGKTGTAEKQGLIPPLDEVEYLTTHFDAIAPNLDIDEVSVKTTEIIIARSREMAELETISEEASTDEEKEKADAKLQSYISIDYLNKGSAMREAIKELSGNTITDDVINQYREEYTSYSWYVSYAPFDDPEIAVVVLIPQGGHGGYSVPVVRDVYADYFDLELPSDD